MTDFLLLLNRVNFLVIEHLYIQVLGDARGMPLHFWSAVQQPSQSCRKLRVRDVKK